MPTALSETLARLLAVPLSTADTLLSLPGDELQAHSSHVCAHGGDTWTLLTTLIDHETEHLGHVLGARTEGGGTRTAMQRLAAQWIEARAAFAGALIGLTDAEFAAPMAPGQWSYQQTAEHLLDLEQHALKTIVRDSTSRGAPATSEAPTTPA